MSRDKQSGSDYELNEIERLLDTFTKEEIKVPTSKLEEQLGDRLVHMNKRKRQPLLKVMVASLILVIVSYITIPEIQVFASQIIENLFHDLGIQKAVDEGYPHIPDIETTIGEYGIKFYNIYIDEQRLSFDMEMKGLPSDEEQVFYTLTTEKDWISDVVITSSSFEGNLPRTSIQVIGEGVKALLEQKQIEIPIILSKQDFRQVGQNDENNNIWEEIGRVKVILQVPEALHQPTRHYKLEEKMEVVEGSITVEGLQVSPTMMKVICSSQTTNRIVTGVNGLQLIGDNKRQYNGRMAFVGSHDEKGGFSENLIPSMYFDNNEKITLIATGYKYKLKSEEKITIKKEDTYPKAIVYQGIPLTLTEVSYNQGILNIGIKGEKSIHRLDSAYMDDTQSMSTGVHMTGDEEITEYVFKFKVPEQDSYEMALDITFEEVERLQCEFNLLEDN